MMKSSLSNFKLLRKLVVLFCFSTPFLASAKSTLYTDGANRRIVQTECDDRVFTKVEITTSVQGGLSALADSITSYLREKDVSVKGKATLTFLVTKSSAIIGIEKLSGRLSSENVVKEALKAYESMWTPALQNKYKVCSVVCLEIESEKDKLLLQMAQQ